VGIKLNVTLVRAGFSSTTLPAVDNLMRELTFLQDLGNFLFIVDLQVFSLPSPSLMLKTSTIHREKDMP
jgi:hypothetical protein